MAQRKPTIYGSFLVWRNTNDIAIQHKLDNGYTYLIAKFNIANLSPIERYELVLSINNYWYENDTLIGIPSHNHYISNRGSVQSNKSKNLRNDLSSCITNVEEVSWH